jgi:hypothetical protein
MARGEGLKMSPLLGGPVGPADRGGPEARDVKRGSPLEPPIGRLAPASSPQRGEIVDAVRHLPDPGSIC